MQSSFGVAFMYGGLRSIIFLLFLLMSPAFAIAAGEPADFFIDRIEPNTALLAGGERITIYGNGFSVSQDPATSVLFGGTPSPSFTVQSASRIIVTVPPASHAGAVDIVVETKDGQRAVAAKGFCYDSGGDWLARWFRTRARLGAIWGVLEQGGAVMIPLGILSVFGLAWALHCVFILRKKELMPRPLLDKLSHHIAHYEIQKAIQACQNDSSVFSRIAAAALRKAGDPAARVREAAQAAGSRESAHLLQKVNYLANVGVLSPMLGLLGTVVGIALAFKTLGMTELDGRHTLLAASIYKAWTSTVGGLAVGIPAMGAYYYLRGQLLQVVTEMEQLTEEIADAITEAGEGA